MYKIFYSDEFLSNLTKFSTYLKDYFYKLYTDTGIIDENIIIDSYYTSIDCLHKNILDKLESNCANGLLGRHIIKEENVLEEGFFYFKINTYTFKVFFDLNKSNKSITINSIEIKT